MKWNGISSRSDQEQANSTSLAQSDKPTANNHDHWNNSNATSFGIEYWCTLCENAYRNGEQINNDDQLHCDNIIYQIIIIIIYWKMKYILFSNMSIPFCMRTVLIGPVFAGSWLFTTLVRTTVLIFVLIVYFSVFCCLVLLLRLHLESITVYYA